MSDTPLPLSGGNLKNMDIKLHSGFLKSFKSCKPFEALCQIIYNSLDASADRIDINVSYDSIFGTVTEISIIDNGYGIEKPNIDKENDHFLSLGFSNKKPGDVNKFGKALHGKSGQGRFKALALGSPIIWETVKNGEAFSLTGYENQKFLTFKNLLKEEVKMGKGTIFKVMGGFDHLKDFPLEKDLSKKLKITFLTTIKDGKVKFMLNGNRILVDDLILKEEENTLENPFDDVKVKSIIWKEESIDNNKIFWCDDSYNSVFEQSLTDECDKKTSNTLYISSRRMTEMKANGDFSLSNMSEDLCKIKNQALDIHENIIINHEKENYDIIKILKKDKIYPFKEDKELTNTEKLTQKLYDGLIIKINQTRPNLFRKSKRDTKLFIVSSLKELLEREPEYIKNILQNILHLKSNEIKEFSDILDKTSLSNIIKVNKQIIERVNFLNCLREIVYGKSAKMTKERSQLQKILERQSWIFGEQYNLQIADKSFNTAIKKIREEMGNYFLDIDEIDGGD
ncbi:MAG: ATP-binding protein, partial [Rickettsiales bacterium]|nr:ATP-binding protein [Rickettsiales bacterium]